MTFVLIVLLVVAPIVTVRAQRIDVPHGSAPVIDGRVAETEWRGSSVQPLPGGGELLLRHDGRHLFVAIRGNVHGFPSLCVTRDDTVRILHASAALGTSIYVRNGGDWRRAADFSWGMRAADDSDDARAQRAAYLSQHGWVGSTVRMGTVPEKELQISIALLASEPRVALGYYVIRDTTVTGWPVALHDGCTDAQLIRGYAPTTTHFQLNQWTDLRLLGPESAPHSSGRPR